MQTAKRSRKRTAKFLHGPREQVCLTPAWLFGLLEARFGTFDFDPAPYPRPADFDGLDERQPWGSRNFLNPPFEHLAAWTARCVTELGKGNETVLLSPHRTHLQWWHDSISGKYPTFPVIGYVRFDGYTDELAASMVVVWFTSTIQPPELYAQRHAIQRPLDVMRTRTGKVHGLGHDEACATCPGAIVCDGVPMLLGPVRAFGSRWKLDAMA